MCAYSRILVKVKYVKIKARMLLNFIPIGTGCPKKVLTVDESSNNSLSFYSLKTFKYSLFIHRLRFWHLSLSKRLKIRLLMDKISFSWEAKLGKFEWSIFEREQVIANRISEHWVILSRLCYFKVGGRVWRSSSFNS